MVVGKRVLHRLDQRHTREDLLAHLVHGVLHTGAVILGKGLEGNFASQLPSSIELVGMSLNLGQAVEPAPLPVGSNISAQDAVPGLLEGSILVTDKAPELGVGALEHGQAIDGGVDVNALALDNVNLHIAGLGTILDERVRVFLAIDVHAHPAVGDDVDVGSVDVGILLNEVRAEDGAEQLRRCHGLLLSSYVDSILDRVGGHDNAVIGFGVAVRRSAC